MTTYERQAHDKAIRLSRKHEDDYYVMRDACYEPCEPESYFVSSGSSRDIHGDTMGCEAVAAYSEGQRLPDFD